MRVLVKKVGKPAEVVEVDFKYRGECAKLISEDKITSEYVHIIPNELAMIVDEDGLPKQLPLNFFMAMDNPIYPIQAIVGNVVFARYKWENPWEKELWDFELEDITDEDISIVERFFDESKQRRLGVRFLGYGG